MIALAIVVLGVFAFPRLPLALLPQFTPPVVSVSVSYPNVAPDSMETLVTRPIENAVSRVAGVDTISSTSSQGQTNVRVQFHYGVNIDTAAVDVQQQVDRIRGQLPNDPNLQTPQIQKADPNALPVVRSYVTDPNMTQRDLGDLFTNFLADEFSSVNGVGSVSVGSDQQRAIMIEPDARLLQVYGISPQQIVSRVSQENVNLPAGIAQIGNNEYLVRSAELYKGADQIGNTVIAVKNGTPIYLHDIAKVSDAIQEEFSYTRLNGIPSVNVNITAQPDANVLSVSAGVYQKMRELEHRYPGMKFGVTLDQQGFIQESINALEHTAIYGAVLAILIIFLFLHSWRSTLVVAISLPISILGTLFAAYAFHFSLNTMTLGGLALAVGLIVDDAIVVIENVNRHLDRGENAKGAAESAVNEIFSAVLASSITVITVFVPLVLIPGLQGLIFTPFAVMVMVAVGISLLVAVTTVPMLASIMLSARARFSNGVSRSNIFKRFAQRFDTVYQRFAKWYAGMLSKAIDRPRLVFGTAAAIFAVTLVLLKLGMVHTEIFPAENSRFIRMFMRMPTGTSLSITNSIAKDIESRLQRDPRVDAVGSSAGGGEGSSNTIFMAIALKPGTTSTQAAQFVRQWQIGLQGTTTGRFSGGTIDPKRVARFRALYGKPIPGIAVFGRTIDIIQQVLSQGQDALDIQIYGPDFKKLYDIAKNEAIPALSGVPGLSRPDARVTDSQPELDVQIDREKAASLGISTQQISQTVSTATNGSTASFLQLNGTEYPIIVQYPRDQRRSYEALANLAIAVPSSVISSGSLGSPTAVAPTVAGQAFSLQTIPLSDLASITIGNGPSQITRQDKQRELDVSASLLDVPLSQVVAQVTPIMDSLNMPPGYYWKFGPSVTQQGDTFSALAIVVILAIILIYMLLAAQFESILHPLVIMVAVPLALAGVVAGLMITQRAFGLTAFIGALMLVGIVVKNAILVVEFTNQLRRRGMSARDAVLQAAPLRLRPILMTTFATVGGMFPIAAGIEAGSETQAPLGTVVIGGLLVSTLLSLIVVPTLYLWVAKHIEPRMGGFRMPTNGEVKPGAIAAVELEPLAPV